MNQAVEKQIKKMLESFLKKEGNLLDATRLFVAKSVLLWAAENAKETKAFKIYVSEVEKHLKGEITLYWEDGTIKVRKEKQV